MSAPVTDPATAAASAPDWSALAQRMRGCVACPPLVATRHQVVVGAWPRGARLLLVGEAPGAAEDLGGRPFVGRGGQLLDALLADAGLDRDAVGVVNVLKCRPPANRTPTRAEIATCQPWLARQVELAAPAVVVTLGLTAGGWAFGPGRLADLRGTVRSLGGRPALATYHPAAALRGGPTGIAATALASDLRTAAGLVAA